MTKSAVIGLCIIVAAVAALAAFKPLTGLKNGTTACGTSATAVTSTDGFNSISAANPSSTVVYFGGSNVSTTNGIPVCTSSSTCVGSALSLDTNQGQLYCIVDSATTTVRHMAGN